MGRALDRQAAWRTPGDVTDAYVLAIRQAVRPGDIVINLSAGAGVHALEACRAGAARVYAVETDRHLSALLQSLAVDNGFDGRLVPVSAAESETDGQATVLVASGLPSFGGIGGFVDAVAAARRRALRPDARCIPERLTLVCAPVDVASWYQRHVERWSEPRFGLSFQPGRRVAVNTVWEAILEEGAPLATSKPVAVVELPSCEPSRLLAAARFVVARPGTLHAVAGWIDATLVHDLDVSQWAAGPAGVIGLPCLFPIDPPVTVERGHGVEVSLRMDVGTHPLWTWRVRVLEGHVERADRRHSTFQALPLDLESAVKGRPDHALTLSDRGRVELERLRGVR